MRRSDDRDSSMPTALVVNAVTREVAIHHRWPDAVSRRLSDNGVSRRIGGRIDSVGP